MAIIQDGAGSGVLASVGGGDAKSLQTVNRPIGGTSLGAYRVAVSTGSLTAVAAATGTAGTLFSLRWGDATRLAVITLVRARIRANVIFPTNQLLGTDIIVVRAFTPSDTGGTAVTPAAAMQKMRTSMGNSLMTDMRVATTAELTASAGRTLDTRAISVNQGMAHTASVTAAASPGAPAMTTPAVIETTFKPEVGHGEHPLVLAQNEGLLVRNLVLLGATGTAVCDIEVSWSEVSAY